MISIDERFKKNKGHYIFQCFLATLVLGVVFSSLNYFFNTALLASLGATSFIVFTIPFKELSKPRYVIGGYTVGTIMGIVAWYFYGLLHYNSMYFGILLGLSVGFSMFFMVVLDFEHPPAAGIPLAIMGTGEYGHNIAVGFIAIFLILTIRRLLKRFLIDLL